MRIDGGVSRLKSPETVRLCVWLLGWMPPHIRGRAHSATRKALAERIAKYVLNLNLFSCKIFLNLIFEFFGTEKKRGSKVLREQWSWFRYRPNEEGAAVGGSPVPGWPVVVVSAFAFAAAVSRSGLGRLPFKPRGGTHPPTQGRGSTEGGRPGD